MKIKRNTPDVFIAEAVPWFMAIALFFFIFAFVGPGIFLVFEGEWLGLIFALGGGGLGFGAMCVFVERLQLILDTGSGHITLRRRTILSSTEDTLPLAALQKAEVESSYTNSDNGRRRIYRPTLVLDEGDGPKFYPITEVYSSGRGADRLVRAINAWIDKRS